jgi:hypothetical protein
MLLRSVMAYDAAYASLGGGDKAFEDGTKFLVANMMKSIVRKVEIALFYGQSGYGVVASTAANVVTIATAEWAPGIWVGSENMRVEISDATGTTLRGDAKVSSVDMTNRAVTLDSLPAGTIATDVIFHYGSKDKEMPGLYKIITNTSSLFGISASQYSLWKGNSYGAAGALTFPKVSLALAQAVEKGLETSVECFVNPRTWSDLMTDMAANRRLDSSYKADKLIEGQESIEFHSQNGKISIHSSIFVKEGHAFLISPEDFQRIGSTDITFKQPGKSDEFFRELENNAGFELRCYSNQSLFCKAPGKQVIITGIVN